MDKAKLKRLNTLRNSKNKKKQGYNVSQLKKDIEVFERQEGIVRHSKAPMIALITLPVFAVIGGGITIGINYHNKQIKVTRFGTLKWSYTTGNRVYSSPVIGSDGTIYVGSDDNKVYTIYGSRGGPVNTP